VSFGPVEVASPTTLVEHVTVENTGDGDAGYDTGYQAITSVPGVNHVIAPGHVTVPAHATRTVTVTLSAPDRSAPTKAVDPTIGRSSGVPGFDCETLAEAGGRRPADADGWVVRRLIGTSRCYARWWARRALPPGCGGGTGPEVRSPIGATTPTTDDSVLSAGPGLPHATGRSLRRGVEVALWVVLIVFAAIVAKAVFASIWALITMAHPDPQWGYTNYNDALLLASGHLSYGDPATGYAGVLYPPLYTSVAAVLLRVHDWTGWGGVITALAAVVRAMFVAGVAYRRPRDRQLVVPRVAEAIAFGFVCLWVAAFVPVSGHLLDFGPDGLSWTLALAGLLVVPAGLRGSNRALAAAVVLLCAAFWAKQPGGTAGLAAGAWALLGVLLGTVTWRRALVLIASMAVLNLVVLGFLSLVTDGWALFLIFEMGRRQDWAAHRYAEIADLTWTVVRIPLAFTVVILGAGVVARVRGSATGDGGERRWGRLLRENDVQQLVLFLLFVMITFGLESYFQRKQGTSVEHHLGYVWGLTLVAAVGWRWAGAAAGPRIVTGSAVAVLLMVGALWGGTGFKAGSAPQVTLNMPELGHMPKQPAFSPDILAVARDHTVYLPLWGPVGIRNDRMPGSYPAVCDLTAAAIPPVWLERALGDRVFDYTYPFPTEDAGECSGNGKWEEGYFWKLNQLMTVGYGPTTLPNGSSFMGKRPESAAAAAAHQLLSCFAPYRLGGVLFRIGKGGGFWCQRTPTDPRLTLGDIPEETSQVLTDGVVTYASGALVVTLPYGSGTATVAALREGEERVLGTVTANTSGTVERRAIAIDSSALKGARLAIYATKGSDARFDFSRLVLHTKDGVLRGAVAKKGLPTS
jgi:hypothetical protein